MSDLDHWPALMAERMKHYPDEAITLTPYWFADRSQLERAGLIVQLVSAMLQRKGAELIALKMRERPARSHAEASAGATGRV